MRRQIVEALESDDVPPDTRRIATLKLNEKVCPPVDTVIDRLGTTCAWLLQNAHPDHRQGLDAALGNARPNLLTMVVDAQERMSRPRRWLLAAGPYRGEGVGREKQAC